jgi:hypothetical protein
MMTTAATASRALADRARSEARNGSSAKKGMNHLRIVPFAYYVIIYQSITALRAIGDAVKHSHLKRDANLIFEINRRR